MTAAYDDREFAVALAVMNIMCSDPNCGPTPHAGYLQASWGVIDAEADVMLALMAERERPK